MEHCKASIVQRGLGVGEACIEKVHEGIGKSVTRKTVT